MLTKRLNSLARIMTSTNLNIRGIIMLDFLSYGFIQQAIVIGIALALSAALLSPFLVLNQQAMIADGLAHVSFAGIILGILLSGEALWIAIPFVMLASLLIKYLSTTKTINGDAAIGLVSSISFAIGLIIVKKSQGFNISIESMLVGNMFTATRSEMILSLLILLFITLFVLFFYRKLFMMTYDLNYAKFSKINVSLLGYLLSALTAFFIVVGVRTIGTLLISALVVFPSVISSQVTKSFKNTLIIGVGSSLIIVVMGIFVAHPLEIPVGSTIVVIYTIVFLLINTLKPLWRK
ncbi:MAG TPA: ABC transporter [Acholeplasmataceae bacterium]|nr:ABC transporter [Acholeplasmataceae bacterium]HBO68342.1 ABC transporter [Acholeplasmataceae bacterium]HBS01679.1 ABC transporter [Acholeplasmataceae bacterium]HCB19997.1 ABC transporter [Acholeplasmataceae bacterium]HCZ23524.1 ABC transporter [Acholeplasmataceae bacterium]